MPRRSSSEPSRGTQPELLVVVPVYRNANTLHALASRALDAFEKNGIDGRLLFVVDGSPDNAWDIIQAQAATDPRVSGLLLSQNAGQHAALLRGLMAARAHWYAVMDADLQDPPELLPGMLRKAQETGATVMAQRLGSYQDPVRMLSSRLFKRLLRWLCHIPPGVGTFFVVSASTAERIIRHAPRHSQLVALTGLYSKSITTVPFQRSPREAGASGYSTLRRLESAWCALACIFECHAGRSAEHAIPSNAVRVNLP